MSEWRNYWTPGEYADMQEVLTAEELEEELVRMRAKTLHLRLARELGFDDGEAALMRMRGLMIEEGGT